MNCLARRLNKMVFSQFSVPFKDIVRHSSGISSDSDFMSLARKYVSGKVILEKDDTSGIAVISLDNRNKKNAMSGSMMCQLFDIISELESWDNGKGIILRGECGTFCSGGDLETVKNILTPQLGYQMSRFMGNLLQRFSQLPMINVALVEGSAIGGGAELAVACDLIVMTEKARFGFVQSKMGVIPGWGAGTRLVKKYGRTKTLDVLASGRVMDAIESKRMGFVYEIFPDSDNVLDLTKSWLNQYCQHDTKVIRNIKSIVPHADRLLLEDSLSIESKLFSEVWGGEANLKALDKNLKH